jgi:hypothetical protein
VAQSQSHLACCGTATAQLAAWLAQQRAATQHTASGLQLELNSHHIARSWRTALHCGTVCNTALCNTLSSFLSCRRVAMHTAISSGGQLFSLLSMLLALLMLLVVVVVVLVAEMLVLHWLLVVLLVAAPGGAPGGCCWWCWLVVVWWWC